MEKLRAGLRRRTKDERLEHVESEHDVVEREDPEGPPRIERSELDPAGRTCVDVGSSTGGFTQFLLMAGAARVYAVDVDLKQLDWRVRQDARVVPVEKNARFLEPADIGELADIVTIDVSFISLTMILPRIPAILKPGGRCVALVKPQFEVGRERVGKGGIVKDEADQRAAVAKCIQAGEAVGLKFAGQAESPITGREGNREFFIQLQHPGGLQGINIFD